MFDDVFRLNGHPESTIDKTKHSQNYQKDPRPLNTEWSCLNRSHISPNVVTTESLTFSGKRVYQYGSRTSLTPSDELSLRTTRNGHALLRNAVYQITSKNCNWPILHREHYTLYPRSCKRTPEQCQLLREETNLKVWKQSPQKYRNQDHCTRKRPRKSTTVRSILHTELQTCPGLPRGTYLETLRTLTLAQ